MANSAAVQALRHTLSLWPRDNLRPVTQLGEALTANLDFTLAGKGQAVSDSEARAQQVALGYILNDQFLKKYPTPLSIRKPASRPGHYDALIRDLDEVPTRSAWAAWWLRLKSKFR